MNTLMARELQDLLQNAGNTAIVSPAGEEMVIQRADPTIKMRRTEGQLKKVETSSIKETRVKKCREIGTQTDR